jgi:hypothetical protein
MDFNSLLGYLTSLALLYAWTLFAAGLFALGEKFCRSLFGPRQLAPSSAPDPAKGRPRGQAKRRISTAVAVTEKPQAISCARSFVKIK